MHQTQTQTQTQTQAERNKAVILEILTTAFSMI
ncbi:hypothetical protein SAMN05442782_0672 [Streptomyces sp. OK228]|nr:hypothetical protein SAMN05442782_0672 [Streptomyces sp. OK228]